MTNVSADNNSFNGKAIIVALTRIFLCVMLVIAALFPCAATSFAANSDRSTADADPDIKVDITGKHEGYSAVLYDNSNGLPTSEANAIAETEEGFIWIGSYSGLIRYDGNEFERIDSTSGIASVLSLFVDSKNRLWIGTNDSGVYVMEKGEYKSFNRGDGLKSLSVRACCEDDKGNVYVATTQGIACIDTDNKLKLIDDDRVQDSYIRDLKKGADGLLYGVTNDNAVFTLKSGKVVDFYDSGALGIDGVIAIEPDPDAPGKVYLGTEESEVYHCTFSAGTKDKTVFDVSPLTYAKGLEMISHELWVCTDDGIGYIKDGKINVLDTVPLTHSIDHVMADYEGNLWFTSSRQGVMKIVKNRFQDVFESLGIKDTVVNTTCLYNDRLYVGTDDGLMILDNDEGEISNDLTAALSGIRIRSILSDSKGNIWISTFSDKGLIRYDGNNIKMFNVENGMPSTRMRAAMEMSDGRTMVACTGGVVIIKGDEIDEMYTDKDGITNTEILTVAEMSNGDLVLGSDGGGIYIIHKGKVRHIGVEEGLSSEVVMRVKKDIADELLWIVTSNSIGYLDSDYNVNTIKNFPYSNNFDLVESDSGDIWVLSSNGIYVVDKENLIANKNIKTIFFGRDNGLPCIATANSYSEVTQSGDLYIAGSTGVAKVNINDPFADVESTKIAVPFVEADNKLIYPDKNGTITVPSDTRKLTVYPYVFTYSLMNPDVTYLLNGFENKAKTVRRSDLGPVDYTNLRGGNYNFDVKITDTMSGESSDISVPIVVKKDFYEQPWFYITVLIVLTALVTMITRFFLKRQARAYQKKEQEDKQYINDITKAFAKTIDMKDKYTNGHSMRVADYTAMLTRELGYDEGTVERFYNIALLHDIGKIGIPDEVLNKPGKLSDEEFALIKSHSSLGYNVLKDISIMPDLATGAGSHHERPDGKGYPNGLKGDEIPRVAQIIAVADTFDAMYSDRPYRRRMNFDKVMSIMEEVKGTQLAPDVVEALLRLADKGMLKAKDDFGGGSTQDIDNIRKGYEESERAKKADAEPEIPE